jgi:hypothetical protein
MATKQVKDGLPDLIIHSIAPVLVGPFLVWHFWESIFLEMPAKPRT